ncbi:MAG TPA: hypothetical protein VKF36_12245, partial [Syntrophorhabdales bacterium]|nr:hypothetical protein [Syntrophorhabdales bacterium]
VVQNIERKRAPCGDGGLMMVQGQKQMMECIPDISTLLRVGHFYFALTFAQILLEMREHQW